MSSIDNRRVEASDFSRMFSVAAAEIPPLFHERLNGMNTAFRPANADELSAYILDLLNKLESPFISRSREENLAAFERGWGENYQMLQSGMTPETALRPGYFRDIPFLRYQRGLVVSDNPQIEHDLFTLARILIFNKYLSNFENIAEIGCGSCQNLLLLARMFPLKKLWGLDWTKASVEIACKLGQLLDVDISGHIFDMSSPVEVPIAEGSALVTIHAMEQLGEDFEPLLEFIFMTKPGLVVHYEPVVEFYNEDNLLDFLAIKYSRKRKYLSGYYTALKSLQNDKKIEILDAWRPYLGGVIHESSLIVWRPI